NPLCGDRITLDVTLRDSQIEQVGYQVKACLLCQAAASVIGAKAPGMAVSEATAAAEQARGLLSGKLDASSLEWPELNAFAPVREVKSRHVCVLLPVQALEEAIAAAQNDPQT
ncbi:MAG: iron-sulfur cluster assembly scaffold protein, partial [Pseudomonadota bacterium]